MREREREKERERERERVVVDLKKWPTIPVLMLVCLITHKTKFVTCSGLNNRRNKMGDGGEKGRENERESHPVENKDLTCSF